MEIRFSERAVEREEVRNFPPSRHRSRRVHKKLCRRFGGETRIVEKPAVFKWRGMLIVHPSLRHNFTSSTFNEVLRQQGAELQRMRQAMEPGLGPLTRRRAIEEAGR